MILSLIFLLVSSSVFSYKTGDAWSYTYSSEVDTVADQTGSEEQKTSFQLSCNANFKVVSVNSNGAYVEMTINTVKSTVTAGPHSSPGQFDRDSEAYYARPMYFTIKNDGLIADVAGHVQDDEDVISLKTSVVYSLQTKSSDTSSLDFQQVSIISPVGSHFSFFQTRKSQSKITVTSHFSETDVKAFRDKNANARQLTLDQDSTHEIVGSDIVSSTSRMTVVSNRQNPLPNGQQSDIKMVTSGVSTLGSFRRLEMADTSSFPYDSAESFLSVSTDYKLIPYLQPSWYQDREAFEEEEEQEQDPKGCLGDIDFCKTFEHTWVIGNPNIGLSVMVMASAGITKGCTNPNRSYMAGAYTEIDVLILGKTLYAVKGHAEWGLMYGQPLRNEIAITVFGKQVYQKDLPWINCIDKTINLGQFGKDFSYTYSVVVYIVTLNFQVGVGFNLRADLSYHVCPQTLRASVSLLPEAMATIYGGAYASVAIAKAGVEISGSIRDWLDPYAWVDGNVCEVGFKLYNNVDPVDVKLTGYYQIKTIKGFKISWGTRKEYIFWRYQWPGRRDKIVEISYSAK